MRAGVLIVEDAADTRELLAELLMHEGYHSIMAASASEALQHMQRIAPDLIITDLAMPGMTGAELIAEVRKSPALGKIPVILLTGSGRDVALAELRRVNASVSAILAKPVNLRALLEAITEAFQAVPGDAV